MTKLMNLKDKSGGPKFDPRAAIFVCNRWDLVPDREKDIVTKDTIRKLRNCWPGFEPKRQLFFMNSLQAMRHAEGGFVAEDYSKLLDGIKYLFPLGLENRTKTIYW